MNGAQHRGNSRPYRDTLFAVLRESGCVHTQLLRACALVCPELVEADLASDAFIGRPRAAMVAIPFCREGLSARGKAFMSQSRSGMRFVSVSHCFFWDRALRPGEPLSHGPFRTHGLRFIPETWVTLLACPVVVAVAKPLARYSAMEARPTLLPSAGRVRFAKMTVGGKRRVEFVWKWRPHFAPFSQSRARCAPTTRLLGRILLRSSQDLGFVWPTT
jgi:hypothetical protein